MLLKNIIPTYFEFYEADGCIQNLNIEKFKINE